MYFWIENNFEQIQKCLYELTDEPTENFHFLIMFDTIDSDLENQIEEFKSEHSDLKIVVIDTLQSYFITK